MQSYKTITQLARELRRNQTAEEDLLWRNLRNRKLNGVKFLRQHPIIYGNGHRNKPLFFIPDFYCAEKKLIVELDGKIHEFQKEYDNNRDNILQELGLKILRIKNEEMQDVSKVLNKIKSML
jgi:very-short-patch-repair endonuclease